jgi:hypothetical protein
MSAPPEDTAKVSRNAAVWVAAITALGGFATAVATGALGLIGKPPPPPKPVIQRWIRIDSAQLGTDPVLPTVDRIRLVAHVNGVSYGYPTSVNSIWAPVGPGMIAERYPLPMGAETYRVRFYGFGLTKDGKQVTRYESRDAVEHTLRHVPFRGATQSLRLTGSSASGLVTGITVRYSIE